MEEDLHALTGLVLRAHLVKAEADVMVAQAALLTAKIQAKQEESRLLQQAICERLTKLKLKRAEE